MIAGLHSVAFGILIVISAMLLVVAAIFIWAVFVRKRGRRHRSNRHHWHAPKLSHEEVDKDPSKGKGIFKFAKQRKRRRKERRNPTLAETGGLPSMRAGEAETPPAS